MIENFEGAIEIYDLYASQFIWVFSDLNIMHNSAFYTDFWRENLGTEHFFGDKFDFKNWVIKYVYNYINYSNNLCWDSELTQIFKSSDINITINSYQLYSQNGKK